MKWLAGVVALVLISFGVWGIANDHATSSKAIDHADARSRRAEEAAANANARAAAAEARAVANEVAIQALRNQIESGGGTPVASAAPAVPGTPSATTSGTTPAATPTTTPALPQCAPGDLFGLLGGKCHL
jgi:hypothetical protein